MGVCTVSFVDNNGIRHSVEVSGAETYFEAGAIALGAFRQHDCAPPSSQALEIEVRTAVTHTVEIERIMRWLNGVARSPKERITKDRLLDRITNPPAEIRPMLAEARTK